MHDAPQTRDPAGHEHVPAEQNVAPLHTWPQDPQLLLFRCVLTQVPLQLVWNVGHAQAPALHCVPPRQTLPHAPQFAGLR